MVSKRYMIQVIVIVVRVKGAPTAVLALHAEDPFGGALDVLTKLFPVHTVQRDGDNGGIIDVGIIIIGIFERPTTRTKTSPALNPIPFHIEDLLFRQPFGGTFKLTCFVRPVSL